MRPSDQGHDDFPVPTDHHHVESATGTVFYRIPLALELMAPKFLAPPIRASRGRHPGRMPHAVRAANDIASPGHRRRPLSVTSSTRRNVGAGIVICGHQCGRPDMHLVRAGAGTMRSWCHAAVRSPNVNDMQLAQVVFAGSAWWGVCGSFRRRRCPVDILQDAALQFSPAWNNSASDRLVEEPLWHHYFNGDRV